MERSLPTKLPRRLFPPGRPSTWSAIVYNIDNIHGSTLADMDDTDDKGIEIECFDAFPPHLIKASLQKNEDTGVVLKTAIEFIGACSAIFLKKILSENPSILQLQQSRDYDFMSGILDDIVPDDERVDERTLSGGLKRRHKHKPPAKRQSKSKKRRYTKKLKEASQLSKETLPILSSSKHKEIEVDDDDYD